jgi:putative glutamine amidotransferase
MKADRSPGAWRGWWATLVPAVDPSAMDLGRRSIVEGPRGGQGEGVPGRPLIGVTTSEVRLAENVEPTREGEPPQREMALGLRYLRAIEAAGGVPVVMPPLGTEALRPLVDRLAGLCLSGGPDLDPETYGASRHPQLGPTERELDRLELAVIRRADEVGMPILAICRGAQALNVARGGSLHQHLPDRDGGICHRQRAPGDQPTHAVQVATGTRVGRLLGASRLAVNSFHHQAPDQLGAGLSAAAWAPDGVIEALEARGPRFVVGVQWHAECLSDRTPEAALFSGFVQAAARYEAGAQVAA